MRTTITILIMDNNDKNHVNSIPSLSLLYSTEKNLWRAESSSLSHVEFVGASVRSVVDSLYTATVLQLLDSSPDPILNSMQSAYATMVSETHGIDEIEDLEGVGLEEIESAIGQTISDGTQAFVFRCRQYQMLYNAIVNGITQILQPLDVFSYVTDPNDGTDRPGSKKYWKADGSNVGIDYVQGRLFELPATRQSNPDEDPKVVFDFMDTFAPHCDDDPDMLSAFIQMYDNKLMTDEEIRHAVEQISEVCNRLLVPCINADEFLDNVLNVENR